MILSERVSGKCSLFGLIAAFALALLVIPSWSIAQQATTPGEPAVGVPGIVAPQATAPGTPSVDAPTGTTTTPPVPEKPSTDVKNTGTSGQPGSPGSGQPERPGSTTPPAVSTPPNGVRLVPVTTPNGQAVYQYHEMKGAPIANDQVLLDLIERGRFQEAQDRIRALRAASIPRLTIENGIPTPAAASANPNSKHVDPRATTWLNGIIWSTDGKFKSTSSNQVQVFQVDPATGKVMVKATPLTRMDAADDYAYALAQLGQAESMRSQLSKGGATKAAVDLADQDIAKAREQVAAAARKLSTEIKDAIKAVEQAKGEYEPLQQRSTEGKVPPNELEAAQERLIQRETRLKQLQSALSLQPSSFKIVDSQTLRFAPPGTPVEVRSPTPGYQTYPDLNQQPVAVPMLAKVPAPPSREPDSKELRGANSLDLADRFLAATTELRLAKARSNRLQKQDGTATLKDVEEAQIGVEQAEKRVKLFTEFTQNAVQIARSAVTTAENNLLQTQELHKAARVTNVEVEVAQGRVNEARALLKQLESVISIVSDSPSPVSR